MINKSSAVKKVQKAGSSLDASGAIKTIVLEQQQQMPY